MVDFKESGQLKDGRMTKIYTIGNNEFNIRVLNYGATLVSINVPDRDGVMRDVVLGFDTASEYEESDSFIGALVGRCANRIKGASFEIDGRRYELTANENANTLHGGRDYYNKRMFGVISVTDDSVTFRQELPDGDQGFPGALTLEVKYKVGPGNKVEIEYKAVSTKDTVFNPTNHSFFNLNGHGGRDVLQHVLRIDAPAYTEVDNELITTGRLIPVEGTPYDFRTPHAIGERISEPEAQRYLGIGTYDVNFAMDSLCGVSMAQAVSIESGIVMNAYTDLPGLQLYVPKDMNGLAGKDGASYGAYPAFCFETQFFPDAIHHDGFKSPILRAGDEFITRTVYKFDTVD